MTRQVRNLLIGCGLFLLVLIGVGIAFTVISPPKAKLTPAQLQQLAAEQAARRLLKAETKDVTAAKKLLAVSFPTKKNSPAPAVGLAASLRICIGVLPTRQGGSGTPTGWPPSDRSCGCGALGVSACQAWRP